jgi:hypothetical protein
MSQKISKFARHFNPTSKMNKQAAKPFLKWAGGKGQKAVESTKIRQ